MTKMLKFILKIVWRLICDILLTLLLIGVAAFIIYYCFNNTDIFIQIKAFLSHIVEYIASLPKYIN